MQRFAKPYLPATLSALLGIVVFAVSLGGTYIYDDVVVILRDPRIRDPHIWHRFWTQRYIANVDNLYRPLTSISYALQWWIHGDRAWAFHLLNLLLHAGVCACVAELTRRLIGFRAALIAGFLFAVHPIHSEAVVSIAGRPELMCALGAMSAFVLMTKRLTTARAIAIAGCAAVALLSKEQGMLVPALLLILALARSKWPDLTQQTMPAQRNGARVLAVLLCWMLAGYLVWRESHLKFAWDRQFMDWTMNPMISGPANPYGGSVGRDRLLIPFVLLGRYVALLVAPLRLSIDYGAKVIASSARLDDPYLWIGSTALVGWILAMILAVQRRSAAAVFALIGLALTYGMIGNIVALIGTIFAERLVYLPSAFIAILLAAVVSRVPLKVVIPLLSVVIVLYAARSITYAARWNDRLKFYDISLREQPDSIRLYILLANEYRLRGQFDEAARVAARGSERVPMYWDIWKQRAQIAIDQKDLDLAQEYLDRAAQLRPENTAEALQFLAQLREQAATTTRSAE